MNKYEVIFILDPRKFDDEGVAFSQSVEKFVTDELDGKVSEIENLGRKQFARPIGKNRAGLYWDFIVEMPADKVSVLHDKFRLDGTVLRLQAFTYVAPPPPVAEAPAESADEE